MARQARWYYGLASMRPPDLPGGNCSRSTPTKLPMLGGFNEAAGFTRRKLVSAVLHDGSSVSFNEAAGFTRRKRALADLLTTPHGDASMRPPDLTGGNQSPYNVTITVHYHASMRPPDLPGGNGLVRRPGTVDPQLQ